MPHNRSRRRCQYDFFLLTSKLQRPAGVPGQARVAYQGVPNMSSILKQDWVARKSLEKDEQLTIGMASASSSSPEVA